MKPRLTMVVAGMTLAITGFLVAEMPTIEPALIDSAPIIDGKLEDFAWNAATLVTDFIQRDPNEGAEPTERTELRVARSETHLFFAFRCFDTEPDKIVHKVMQRDTSMTPDDSVFVLIDPFGAEHEGFLFQLNANGAKLDGKLSGRSPSPDSNWDALWDGAATIDAEGWNAEFAIPFRSLDFDPDVTAWSVNFQRRIARREEQIRWTAAIRNRAFFRLEGSGRLTGMEIPERAAGLGIDFKPYFTARGSHDGEFDFDTGADVFYQIRPNITGVLTINTDFAETEVDRRQVNLTRFPLFFPEKRDFFLEGAEYFQFGSNRSKANSFHSRTIGLSSRGEKVDIPVGLKVTGREGKLGIGAFGSQLAKTGDLDEDEVFVGRVTYDVFDESRVGAFVSHGDPRGNSDNSVGGFDLHLKDSTFHGDNVLNTRLWGLVSDDNGVVGESVGMEVSYDNTPFATEFGAEQIDDDFRPGTGFLSRTGRQYWFGLKYDWYPSDHWLYSWSLVGSGAIHTSTDGAIESEIYRPEFRAQTRARDHFKIQPNFRREVLFEDFEIQRGHVIPAGDYAFNGISAEFASTATRPLQLSGKFRIGEFFHGDSWTAGSTLTWRPTRYFQFEAGGEFNAIDLPAPTGEFETLVGFIGLRVTPNARLSWNTIGQWDTVTDQLGVQSRVRWIVRPGHDVFLSVNHGFDVNDYGFVSLGGETISKVGLTIRF